MKQILKGNIKLIVGIILGVILSGFTVYAADILLNSNQVGYDNTNTNLQINNSSVDNVQDAIDAIYTKVNTQLNTCLASLANGQSQPTPSCNSPFKLGDYVDMTPTATTFSTDTTYTNYRQVQTLHPNYLNVWRVLRINSDCTVELVSEYVSESGISFKGKEGYQNFVYYLNEIAKQYANTTYTLNPSTAPDGAFRNVGYDPQRQTARITDTTRLDNGSIGASNEPWYNKTTPINGEESLGGGDQGYATDYKLMQEAGIGFVAFTKTSAANLDTTSATMGNYWLASRMYYWEGNNRWNYAGRVAGNYGVVGANPFYSYSNGSVSMNYNAYSVRPIVTLKSGLSIASGAGTSASHYTLRAS